MTMGGGIKEYQFDSHALETVLPKLVRAGHRVCIYEAEPRFLSCRHPNFVYIFIKTAEFFYKLIREWHFAIHNLRERRFDITE